MHGDVQRRLIKFMNQVKGKYKNPEDFFKNGFDERNSFFAKNDAVLRTI